LPEGTRVMVFECTHPQILRESRVRLFNGVGVETRGGTTLVPAVDFALQCASGNVIVVGADLGYGSRAYASGARRESAAETGTSVVAPKFLAMRAALESLLERNTRPGRIVYHVLSAGPVLRGARRAQPRELDAMLTRKAITKEMV
jgi:hypothetical protein